MYQGGFGQNQQQNTSGFFGGGGGTGGFGGQGVPQGTGGFGALGQNPQTPIFGGGAPQQQPMGGGFGGNQGGLFGQQQNPTGFGGFGGGGAGAGFGGNAPSNQASGSNFSSFSQAAGNRYGQSTFGGTTSSSGFGGNQYGGNLGGGFGQTQSLSQQQPQIGPGYYKSVPFDQTAMTHNHYFQNKSEQLPEQKGAQTGLFHNIRAEPKFAALSNQMLKVLDVLANMQGGQPQLSYENIALQEFSANSNNYIYLSKVSGQGAQQPQMGLNMGGGSSGFFGGQQPSGGGFGGGFGQQQQQQKPWQAGAPQQSTLFGGGGGLNQQQQTPGFGQQNTGFGQQQPGGFGQNKPMFGGTLGQPAQSTGLGQVSTSIFGQQNQGLSQGGFNKPGGLFGQTSTPAAGGGFLGTQGGAGGTSLFGQQQQQQPLGGGSLFGQSTPGFGQTSGFGQQQQPAAQSNLFGATPLQQQQPQSTPSLFGQSQPSQPSLFGGQPQNQGSSLFGGQPQQQQTLTLGATGQQTGIQMGGQQSSLFGAKPALGGGQPTSLFGQPSAQPTLQQQPSSLFGGASANPAGSSLFGQTQTQQQQQPGSNLFGAKPLTTSQPGTSLFGQQQQTTMPQTPSLFSNLSAQQPTTTGSLFGQSQPTQNLQQQPQGQMFSLQGQPMQQQQMQNAQQYWNPHLDANARKDAYGIMQYLSKPVAIPENDKDIQEAVKGLKERAATVKDPWETMKQDRYQPFSGGYLSTQVPQIIIEREEAHSLLKDQLQKKYYDIEDDENERGVFNVEKGFTVRKGADILHKMTTFGTDPSLQGSNYVSRQNSYQRGSIYATPGVTASRPNQYLQPTVQKSASYAQERSTIINKRSMIEEDSELEKPMPSQNPDVLDIDIVFSDENANDRIETLKIHRSRDVKDIYGRVDNLLIKEGLLDSRGQDYWLLYKNAVLKKDLSLEQAGITQSTKVQVIYTEKENSQQQERVPSPPKTSISMQKSPNKTERTSIASGRKPLPPKPGYLTTPSMEELNRMSLDDLRKVKYFKILNEHGSIQFEGETDLVDVDLADIVTIVSKVAEVYEDERHSKTKPPIGQKLNKPAVITLNNIDPKKEATQEGKEQALKKAAYDNEAQHISYDYARKVWQFKVFHFTKYLFSEEDESSAEAQQQQQQQQQQYNYQAPVQVQTTTSQFIREDQQQQQQPLSYNQTLFPQTTAASTIKFMQRSSNAPLYNTSFPELPAAPFQVEISPLPHQQQLSPASDQGIKLPSKSDTFQKPPSYYVPVLDKENKGDNNYQGLQYAAPRRRRQEDEQSVASSIISQEFDDSEEMIDLQQQQPTFGQSRLYVDQARPERQKEIMKRAEESSKKNNDILTKIDEKDRKFNNIKRNLLKPRSGMKDCMAYLENIGIEMKNNAQNQTVMWSKVPNPMPRFRPQFRNDGKLLILKSPKLQKNPLKLQTSSLSLYEIPNTKDIENSKSKELYQDFSDILLKHTDIQGTDSEMKQLPQKDIREHLEKLNIGQKGGQQQSNYEDTFIKKTFLLAKMPVVTFRNSPNDMFFVLEDFAQSLITKITRSQELGLSQDMIIKLRQQFYVVCTLNALFGNPNVHLVQLHPGFLGIRNYEQSRSTYADNPDEFRNFKDGFNAQVDKKRRNALTEVFRFICQQEFGGQKLECPPNANIDQIYQVCLEYLLNGDIQSALAHLNKFKKIKMAYYVAQAFNSEFCKQALKSEFLNMGILQKKRFNQSALSIVDYITGQLKINNNIGWMRTFLYHLLIVAPCTETLEQSLKVFDVEVIQKHYKNDNPLLWLLIKYYGFNNRNPDILHNSLSTYSNVDVYPIKWSPNDNRLQFLVTFFLYNLGKYQNQSFEIRRCYGEKYKDSQIRDIAFVQQISLYVNQLLQENDWFQALLIAQYIPPRLNDYKKKLLFDILQMKAIYLIQHQSFEQNFDEIRKTLKIPVQILAMARANLMQYRHLYERSIHDWSLADNNNMVHQLLMNHILPLYYHSSFLLILPDEQKQRAIYNQIKGALETQSKFIVDWESKGGLFLNFLRMIIEKKDKDKELDLRSIAIHIMPELMEAHVNEGTNKKYRRTDVKNDYIQRFIWEFILVEDQKLKIERAKQDAVDLVQVAGRLSKEPLQEIISVYPDYPELSRYNDEYAEKSLVQLYCAKNQWQ